MLVNIHGTSIHIEKIKYPEKINDSLAEDVLRLHLYSGAKIDVRYNGSKSLRDRDYNRVIWAVNLLQQG